MPRPTPTLAEQLVARVCVYEPVSLQTVAAARELSRLSPADAALALQALLALAQGGGAREVLTLDAMGRAILSAPPHQLSASHRQEILQAARDAGLPGVVALFDAPAPTLSIDARARLRADPQIAHLSLGHKKMLARSGNPDLLARLAAEGDPRVIENVLLNPRLTEALVVRIVARRPIRADVLRRVFEHRRWSASERVREAMAQNPYCEPELALKILPTLSRPVLRGVAERRGLHPAVRQFALALLGPERDPTQG